MSACRCPICHGETHEIRAKLVCRRCGAILETCCEGGPMSGIDPEPSAARPLPPAQPDKRESG